MIDETISERQATSKNAEAWLDLVKSAVEHRLLALFAFGLAFTCWNTLVFAAFRAGVAIAIPTGFAVRTFLLAATWLFCCHLSFSPLVSSCRTSLLTGSANHGEQQLHNAVVLQWGQSNDFRRCADDDPEDRARKKVFHQALGKPVFMLGRLTGVITTGNGVFLAT